MLISDIRSLLQKADGANTLLERQLKTTQSERVLKDESLQMTEKAQVFLQTTAQATQEQLRYHIEDIVNLALDSCFPDTYTFRVNFNIARGKTEAVLVFVDKKTGFELSPMQANGGGAVDLASFALRLSCYTLGTTDKVIVLDEPFRFLSKNLVPMASEVIESLSTKLGVQFIIVTHIDELSNIAQKVFTVRKKEGKSSVTAGGKDDTQAMEKDEKTQVLA